MSYSWDSEKHKEWVRQLADKLTLNGVTTRLDQWDLKVGESYTHFMEKEVELADFIIVVCTPNYARKSTSRIGGVGYEQQIVSGQLISGYPRARFLPIIRHGEYSGDNRAIPIHFGGTKCIDFRDVKDFETGFRRVAEGYFRIPSFCCSSSRLSALLQ